MYLKNIINHIIFLIFLSSLIFSCSQTEHTEQTSENTSNQPNIVFILADDVGWSEVGYNSEIKKYTPNIDKLHAGGLSLTQFYVHAVCAPSRTALMTGRYPFRNWSDWRTEDFGKPSYLEKLGMKLSKNDAGEETRRIHALPTEERTIAEGLQEAGYFTAIAGKWGCGEWLPEHLPYGPRIYASIWALCLGNRLYQLHHSSQLPCAVCCL